MHKALLGVVCFSALVSAEPIPNHPLLQPPSLLAPDLMTPDPEAYMAPIEDPDSPGMLFYCPPDFFTELAAPEPWSDFGLYNWEDAEPPAPQPEETPDSDFLLTPSFHSFEVSPLQAVPEPASVLFVGSGVALLLFGMLPRRSKR